MICSEQYEVVFWMALRCVCVCLKIPTACKCCCRSGFSEDTCVNQVWERRTTAQANVNRLKRASRCLFSLESHKIMLWRKNQVKDTSLLSWQSVLRLCIFDESWFYWYGFSQHSKLRSLTHTLCVHFLAHVHVSHIDFISYVSDLSVELDAIDVWLNPYFITLPQYVNSSILGSHLLFSSLKKIAHVVCSA